MVKDLLVGVFGFIAALLTAGFLVENIGQLELLAVGLISAAACVYLAGRTSFPSL
jgi:hypothetical protein